MVISIAVVIPILCFLNSQTVLNLWYYSNCLFINQIAQKISWVYVYQFHQRSMLKGQIPGLFPPETVKLVSLTLKYFVFLFSLSLALFCFLSLPVSFIYLYIFPFDFCSIIFVAVFTTIAGISEAGNTVFKKKSLLTEFEFSYAIFDHVTINDILQNSGSNT